MGKNENIIAKDLKENIQKLKDEKYIKEGWLDDLPDEIINDDIVNCINSCTSPTGNTIEEKLKAIFRAFSLFPISETKVLILGQDPYPETEKACGLAFLHDIKNYPKIDDTLKNIFNELKNIENKSQKKYDKNPIEWARQNKVLLLNAALTFDSDNTLKKRINIWSTFINEIIEKLINKKNPIAVMLWGGCANLIEPFQNNDKYKNNENILILRSSHPSNQGKNYCGFYDSVAKSIFNLKNTPLTQIIPAYVCEGIKHFKQCNDFLKKNKKNEIDWKGLIDIYDYKG